MKTPWADWLRRACAAGIAPAEFWRLSLWEWRALNARVALAPARGEMEELMRKYPDADESGKRMEI